MLMLTSNRVPVRGYNGSVIRAAMHTPQRSRRTGANLAFEISGKRGIAAMKFRQVAIDQMYTQFEDSPKFEDVAVIADRLMEEFISGKIDRLEVVYTIPEHLQASGCFRNARASIQAATVEKSEAEKGSKADYEFLPSAESILEEVVPASFRVKLFK